MSAISNWLPTPPDNFSTTLSSSINTSALSIPLNSVSGLGTEGVGVLFRKDSNGDVVAGSIEFIHWTNISGSNLTLTNTGDRGLTGSDAGAQSYSAGDFFEIWVSSYYYDSQRDGFTVEHNQDGTHKAAALDAMVSGTEANGDLIYRTGGAWTRLAAGSNGKVLKVVSGEPAWGDVNVPQGYMLNGKISVTVASNNITVALKTLAGSDPSSTDPVRVRIGDTIREITSALSVTKNAGTNWFNSGSSELAAKEIDYFVYLGYNATDGVTIGFARIPSATQYGDFSATTTNEKYCAISTITNAASTDYYENIGRFAATLGVSATYLWTVPTFTASNLIQRPIYDSSRKFFLPSWTSSGTQPTIGNGILYGDYTVQGHRVSGVIYMQVGSTSTVGTGTYSWQLPFKCNSDTYSHGVGQAQMLDSGTQWYMAGAILTAANASTFNVSYHAQTGGNWGAAVPVIPANGDTYRVEFSYEI